MEKCCKNCNSMVREVCINPYSENFLKDVSDDDCCYMWTEVENDEENDAE